MYTVIETPGWGGGSLRFFGGKGQRGCKNIQRGILGFNEFLLANCVFMDVMDTIISFASAFPELNVLLDSFELEIKKNDDLRLGQFSSNSC